MFPSQLKRSPIKRSADESDDWNLNNLEEMRSRHPMFRLPNWASDDDDMSNLSSRMSQTPHFGTANMRGPWRERRDSGGPVAGSDSVDGHRIHSEPIQIPIRIEAEAPPGWISPSNHNTGVQEDKSLRDQEKQEPEQTREEPPQTTEPLLCVGNIRKQPQYASRTTSAVNALKQDDIPRDTRCASAPPDMPNPRNSHQFVSSMKVIPQNTTEKSQSGSSPVFNNVPKPYSKVSQTPPIREERTIPTENVSNNTQHFTPHFEERQESHPYQQYQPHPQPHWGSPASKSSVVRNIPIMIEGRDEESCSPSRSPQQASHRENPRWDSNQSYKFPQSYEFSRPDLQGEIKQNHHPNHFQYQHSPQPADHRFQERHQQEPLQRPEQVHQQTDDMKLGEEVPKEDIKPIDIKMNAIDEVRATVAGYQEQVAKFQGLKLDKEYRYLDEMLTRALLQLDDIDPDGRDDVRQARRALVKDINETIANLEKLAKDGKNEERLPSTAPAEEITLNEGSKSEPNCTGTETIQLVSEKIEPECPKDSQDTADPPQASSTDQPTEIKNNSVGDEIKTNNNESGSENCQTN